MDELYATLCVYVFSTAPESIETNIFLKNNDVVMSPSGHKRSAYTRIKQLPSEPERRPSIRRLSRRGRDGCHSSRPPEGSVTSCCSDLGTVTKHLFSLQLCQHFPPNQHEVQTRLVTLCLICNKSENKNKNLLCLFFNGAGALLIGAVLIGSRWRMARTVVAKSY